jgi:hypothetical protein
MPGNAKRIAFLSLLLIASVARAQNCPQGMVPEGGQGVASCAPSGNDAQPQGHWVSQWGAVATDDANHSSGASFNQVSEEKAKQAALDNCVANGGANCIINITYGNACVAIVAGDKLAKFARAKTIAEAVQMGTEACANAGDVNCKAQYTSCSEPKWVQ